MNVRPRIKKKTTYNVLLMRDDSPVRSIRMKRSTLRFLCVFCIFFFGGGIAAGALAVRYMERYYSLQAEHKTMQQAYAEARLQLEQLTNVKTLVENTEGEKETARNDEVGAEPQAMETAAGPNVASVNATALQRNASLIVAQGGTTPAVQVAGNATAPNPLQNIPELGGTHSPMRIANFNWRTVGEKRLRLRFDISTLGGKAVSGHMQFFAIGKNGEQLEMAVENPEEARFAITRMRPTEAVVTLPENMVAAQLAEVRILVALEDAGQFQWGYRFSR